MIQEPLLQPLRIPSGWKINYNDLREIEPSSALERHWYFFREDLFQAKSTGSRTIVVDLGWYPSGNLFEGAFTLVCMEPDFLGIELETFTRRSLFEIVVELERMLLYYSNI